MQDLNSLKKNFIKSLDKPQNLCYNKYVRKQENETLKNEKGKTYDLH